MFRTALCLLAVAGSLSAADFNFLVYSDIQGGGEKHHVLLPEIIARIPGGVAFAITCGDQAGINNALNAQEDTWERFLGNAMKLGVTFWPCRGNHDGKDAEDGVTLENWRKAMGFVRDRAEYQDDGPNDNYYSFMYHNNLFVVIDNTVGDKSAEIEWLAKEAESERARNADNIFLFMHYPQFAPEMPEEKRLYKKRWERFVEPTFGKRSNLRAAFWGHNHWFWKGEYKGVKGIMVPPSTAPRVGKEHGGEGELFGAFSGYIIVHVSGDKVEAKVYDYGEVPQAEFAIRE